MVGGSSIFQKYTAATDKYVEFVDLLIILG